MSELCKFKITYVLLFVLSTATFAQDIEVCKLNPDLFYMVVAKQEDRQQLTELAVESNDIYKTRTAPVSTALEIFSITPEQINDGLVEKLMQKNCSVVLGFYALKTEPSDMAKQRIKLNLLFVNHKYIKQGIGTRLFNRAIDKARSIGMKTMHWISDPDARLFYTKYGATITGLDQNILDPKVPVVLFNMDLSKSTNDHNM